MNHVDIFLLLVLLLLLYIHLYKKEGFQYSNQYFNQYFNQYANLVDPYSCYPGTYSRNNIYKTTCNVNNKTSEISHVTPETRYNLVCNVDKHLNRHCKLVKISPHIFY